MKQNLREPGAKVVLRLIGRGWVLPSVLLVLGGVSAAGQNAEATRGPERIAAGDESTSLPDAPTAVGPAANAGDWQTQGQGSRGRTRMVGPFDKFVQAGETAPRLTVGDKILMGVRGSVSPYAVLGWFTSATYSEAINGSPYYGQDGKDYLQRLGAASAKATSEDLFTVSVLAPVLHEDPRYYQKGRGHSFVSRFGYSVSRVLVTKTDAGGQTVNFAVLGGNLAGSALTQAYYPPDSRGLGEVMETFGTSLLGQAVGNLFDEFVLSSAEFLQLKHRVDLDRVK